MNIAIIGYGKMGRTIEGIVKERGHTISNIIDSHELLCKKIKNAQWDVAIEFTQPESAYKNIKLCLEYKIPIVSGTTGWLERLDEIKSICTKQKTAFFYASNFSIGVNLFFTLNEFLAKMMNHHSEYDVSIKETHHIHKKDSPSGTAITLAEGIIDHINNKERWGNNKQKITQDINSNILHIQSERIDEVPGTHHIKYSSPIDSIEIIHEAHNRKGFALGAVLAAEFIKGKRGLFGMKDLLQQTFK